MSFRSMRARRSPVRSPSRPLGVGRNVVTRPSPSRSVQAQKEETANLLTEQAETRRLRRALEDVDERIETIQHHITNTDDPHELDTLERRRVGLLERRTALIEAQSDRQRRVDALDRRCHQRDFSRKSRVGTLPTAGEAAWRRDRRRAQSAALDDQITAREAYRREQRAQVAQARAGASAREAEAPLPPYMKREMQRTDKRVMQERYAAQLREQVEARKQRTALEDASGDLVQEARARALRAQVWQHSLEDQLGRHDAPLAEPLTARQVVHETRGQRVSPERMRRMEQAAVYRGSLDALRAERMQARAQPSDYHARRDRYEELEPWEQFKDPASAQGAPPPKHAPMQRRHFGGAHAESDAGVWNWDQRSPSRASQRSLSRGPYDQDQGQGGYSRDPYQGQGQGHGGYSRGPYDQGHRHGGYSHEGGRW